MPYKVGLPPESPPQIKGGSLISNKPVILVSSGDRKSKSVEAEDNLTLIRAWVVDRVYGDNEELRAILICSAMLEAQLWVVWDRSFGPKDNLAVYYAEEIPLLRDKTPEELKAIHAAKLRFPGCRILQEGPESKE